MAIKIPGYEDAEQAAARLKVTVQHVYNLNSSRDDFPKPVYVGRTPCGRLTGSTPGAQHTRSPGTETKDVHF